MHHDDGTCGFTVLFHTFLYHAFPVGFLDAALHAQLVVEIVVLVPEMIDSEGEGDEQYALCGPQEHGLLSFRLLLVLLALGILLRLCVLHGYHFGRLWPYIAECDDECQIARCQYVVSRQVERLVLQRKVGQGSPVDINDVSLMIYITIVEQGDSHNG